MWTDIMNQRDTEGIQGNIKDTQREKKKNR